MTLKIRRVVTGHQADGEAVVTDDYEMTNIQRLRSGNSQTLIWVTDGTPAEVDGAEDPAGREMDIEPPELGSVFRILELPPGKDAYMHRTDTIDYALILAGECDMVLDASEVHMNAGDVMVQRGTWHGWTNRGTEPCQIAFILIGAKAPERHLHPED